MSTINHPQHYNLPNRKECIVEMEEQFGIECTATFCLMNAYKYLYRAGNKENNSADQDIAKAKWYYSWVKNRAKDIDIYNTLNFDNVYNLYRKIGGMLDGK